MGSSRTSAWWTRWIAGAALVCAVFAAYLPAFKAGFVLDDDAALTQSPVIQAPDGLHRIWFTSEASDYWPVTWTTLWIEWRLWGMNPAGYHVTNVALHAIEVVLLWALLRRLRLPGAFLAALLFAVHPVNVESVAWIVQRKNLMAMLFYLLSILWFLKTGAADEGGEASASMRGLPGFWYWMSLGAFVLAMLSKGSVAILPAVLLGLVIWRRRPRLRDGALLVPYGVVAVALTWVNVHLQNRLIAEEPFHAPRLIQRILGAGAAVEFYLSKAVWPSNLIFIYPQWKIDPHNPAWWLPLATAVGLTAALFACRRRGTREALFAWGYFCVCLLPVMGLANIAFMRFSWVADHYQHLAIIGVVAFAAAGWSRLMAAARGPARAVLGAVAVAAVVVLAILTSLQCRIYAGPATIYRDTLARNPGCWMAANNLAGILPDAPGEREKAVQLFETALRLNPDYAEAHNNLGTILASEPGRRDEAIAHYRAALRIRPSYAEAHNNLGAALAAMPGRQVEAIAQYEAAIRAKPDYPDPHSNLAALLTPLPGRRAEAIRQCEDALRLRPDFADAHYNLGIALAAEPGRTNEAIAQYAAALRINPCFAEAHSNLANVLLRIPGRRADAIAHYEEAVRIKPDYANAHYNLALVLAGIPGRRTEALLHCVKAVELEPGFAAARALRDQLSKEIP